MSYDDENTSNTQGKKVILVGNSGVGKTSLLTRYATGKFDPTITSTQMPDITHKKQMGFDKYANPVKLAIWDTAGQEKFKSIAKMYYRGSTGMILCYNIRDKESFHACAGWIEELLEADFCSLHRVILVGTQRDEYETGGGDQESIDEHSSDRRSKRSTSSNKTMKGIDDYRQVSWQDAWEFSVSAGLYFCETSSKTGFGVDNVFRLLAQQINKEIDLSSSSSLQRSASPYDELVPKDSKYDGDDCDRGLSDFVETVRSEQDAEETHKRLHLKQKKSQENLYGLKEDTRACSNTVNLSRIDEDMRTDVEDEGFCGCG